MAKPGSNGMSIKSFVGMIVGAVCLLILGIFLYLKFGPVPVAVADSPFPLERQIVKIALRARIGRQMKTAPFAVNEVALESGAQIYREHCSICHGTPGHDAQYAAHLYPAPPQLWKKHGTHGAVGLSEEEPGLAYWIVSNGIRLTGMPSFSHILSDTQMWQVSLLLKNANKELPAPVSQILNAPQQYAQQSRQ
jgi:thiosulfate dehydrogenase